MTAKLADRGSGEMMLQADSRTKGGQGIPCLVAVFEFRSRDQGESLIMGKETKPLYIFYPRIWTEGGREAPGHSLQEKGGRDRG